MIAPEAQTQDDLVRRSFVAIAGNYIKHVWIKKNCLECRGTGSKTCPNCAGKGIIAGDGIDAPRELCRRCIGTGKEECPCCQGIEADASNPADDE